MVIGAIRIRPDCLTHSAIAVSHWIQCIDVLVFSLNADQQVKSSSLLMVTIAVGVLIATVILSAISMLSFAQGGYREMTMDNSGKER
ncbi:MAG TPA: hypothetical protein VFS97_12975 [Nitrososphaeraceae archaeon]|nr:hypothetical protein [Nitrososphaeraceae archaeon]